MLQSSRRVVIDRGRRRETREPHRLETMITSPFETISDRIQASPAQMRLTAGLKSPPDMRKKTHTFTIKLKPNERAMYSSLIGLNPVTWFVMVPAGVSLPIFAISAPANAKKRNIVVPTNSPIEATIWFLAVLFIKLGHIKPPGTGAEPF